VGSFKSAKDADGLRAKLILLGMKARIQQAKVKGVNYHRVQIGPFDSSSNLKEVKKRLSDQKIAFFLIKEKNS